MLGRIYMHVQMRILFFVCLILALLQESRPSGKETRAKQKEVNAKAARDAEDGEDEEHEDAEEERHKSAKRGSQSKHAKRDRATSDNCDDCVTDDIDDDFMPVKPWVKGRRVNTSAASTSAQKSITSTLAVSCRAKEHPSLL
jgi:hypothetical protein